MHAGIIAITELAGEGLTSSLCFSRKVRQSLMRSNAHTFGQARFGFSIQLGPLRGRKQKAAMR